MLWGPW
jgi:hypothetical protein